MHYLFHSLRVYYCSYSTQLRDDNLGPSEREGTWDFSRFSGLSSERLHCLQSQLRLTAQRLGQLRNRKDAQGQVIGRDISILLQQGNETLARAKAQRLIQDEIMGDLLQSLEVQIGVILEHFSELERHVFNHFVLLSYITKFSSGNLSPAVVEAASTVIFAAPQVDSKGMTLLRYSTSTVSDI